ncbi:MAG: class I SAM-dependent methyltransferase [Christensenellales bacterium]
MKLNEIEKYYNKFNEDKRLLSRHGQVEFYTSMQYIKKYLKRFKNPKILDIGAGTGRYSICLSDMGYDVTAVELVLHNLRVLQQKNSKIKSFKGNALDLKRFDDESFDVVLLLGPMYHLFSEQDKLQALAEAKRVVKTGGIIFVAYYMNEYAVLVHGFRDNFILQNIKDGKLDKDFKIKNDISNLYSMERLEDIKRYSKIAGLKRLKTIAPDGASDYMRPVLNKMDKETFDAFLKYNLSVCEKKELLGASSHILDILKK